jgi:hypothetical protein
MTRHDGPNAEVKAFLAKHNLKLCRTCKGSGTVTKFLMGIGPRKITCDCQEPTPNYESGPK